MSSLIEEEGGPRLLEWAAGSGRKRPVMRLYPLASPAGEAWIGFHERMVVWLSFGPLDTEALANYWNGPVEEGTECPVSREELEAVLCGRGSLELMPVGSRFQIEVWKHLLRIPFSATRTYGDIAAEMGSRKRARAVGTAVGANPIAWLIPCHRVLPASGGTGNYRWGAAVKQTLLDWERVSRPAGSGTRSEESRRKLEAMLVNAKRFEDIANLAGDIAHDLNNLLAPIRMATQLLKRKIADESLDRYVDIIETSTGRARSVIQEILSFSRENGDEKRHALDVNPILREIEAITRATFPRQIRIQFTYQDDAPLVRMDPTQLHRAVLNILVNARDAIAGEGTIAVRVSTHDLEMKVSVGELYLAPGRFVCISIADTGSGSPAGNRDRIFDPFFTTKPKEEGTGLGLASVYGIVARSGGFIDLESVVGEGSTFHLYIPEGAEIRSA